MHHTVCISSPVPKEPVDRVDCGVDDRQLGYSWGLFLVISKKKKIDPECFINQDRFTSVFERNLPQRYPLFG
jgi:hypothetical protein